MDDVLTTLNYAWTKYSMCVIIVRTLVHNIRNRKVRKNTLTALPSRFTSCRGLIYYPYPEIPALATEQRVQGDAPPGKSLKYVPLRCHFLHFEITVIDLMENSGVFNRQWKLRPIGPYHIDSLSHQCITTPKIIAGSCSAGCRKVKNGWETTEERQRIVLKRTG